MPTCVICESTFYPRDWGSPHEDCDCGACASWRDQDEMPEWFADRKKRWEQQCEAERQAAEMARRAAM